MAYWYDGAALAATRSPVIALFWCLIKFTTTTTTTTCYFELRRLASIRRFLTSTATSTLVSAFVMSRIDYCNKLLFDSTHDVTSHLQRIQNYAARVILRLPVSSSITTHLRSLHWLPVKVRSTYKIAFCATTATAVLHHHMSLTCCIESHCIPATHAPAHRPCLFSIDMRR